MSEFYCGYVKTPYFCHVYMYRSYIGHRNNWDLYIFLNIKILWFYLFRWSILNTWVICKKKFDKNAIGYWVMAIFMLKSWKWAYQKNGVFRVWIPIFFLRTTIFLHVFSLSIMWYVSSSRLGGVHSNPIWLLDYFYIISVRISVCTLLK